MKSKKTGIAGLLAAIAGFVAAPAEITAAETPTVSTLEEIIVSARRRSESLQDVPDSITAFGSALIEDAGITNMADISNMTPGLWYSGDQHVGASNITTMRGITQNRNQDAPVAFVIDDVTLATSLLFSQDFFDIEQVEVLRGPQGSLYGRNSLGGAVVIRTKAPGNEPEYSIKTSYAEGSDFRIQGSASGPIIEDKLLYRVAANFADADGLIFNDYYGVEGDFYDARGIRGKLILNATDKLTFDLRANVVRREGPSGLWQSDRMDVANGEEFIFSAETFEAGLIQNDVLGNGSLDFEDVTLKVSYDLGFAELTSITNHTHVSQFFQTDLDYTPLPIISADVNPEENDVFMEELRLNSNGDGPLSWVAGAFYQTNDRIKDIDIYQGVNQDDPGVAPASTVPSSTESDAYAFFGQVNYDITDDLELTLGARYDSDDRLNVLNGDAETYSRFQPKVSLSYDVSDDLMVYGTWGVGFRPGGFNATDAFGRQYESEETENFELGFKTTLANGRVNIAGAVYDIDYSQQQFFVFGATAGQALTNLDASSVSGVELELQAKITDNLDISLGYAKTDATIDEFGDFTGTDIDTSRLDPSLINGNDLNYSPDYTFNLGIQWTQPLAGDMRLIARADYQNTGQIWWFVDNVEAQTPYDLLNLRLGVERDGWSVTGFIRNATDEDYDTFSFIGRFIASGERALTNPAWRGKPRQAGLEFSYRF